ncbi:MAG: integrase core domain-containing protein [Cellvibrionaceae bacterium]
MKNVVILIWHIVATLVQLFKTNGTRTIIAENIALKHQLIVMSRSQKRSPRLNHSDRFILGLCSLWLTPSRRLKTTIIVKPSTLLNFHKALVKKKYKTLFSSNHMRKTGPKGPSQELINAIVEMKQRNPRFGCPRITQQINLAFGLDINKDTVRRILDKYYKPTSDNSGPSWLTFLGHTKDSLWSVDFFRCESINLKSYWVMVVMDQFSRRIIGFAVHAGDLDGTAACRMFNEIASKQLLPTRLSSDNDRLFEFHRWKANLRIREIEEVKSIPGTPTSHPFVERLIGTVRRELLDQTFFWNQSDLERKLDLFKDYFNQNRVHTSRDGKTPINQCKSHLKLNKFGWQRHCRGLFQLPFLA